MKVLHVVTLMSDDGAFGGPMRVALNQSQALNDIGYEAVVCTAVLSRRPAEHAPIDGVRVRQFLAFRLPKSPRFSGIISPSMIWWLFRNVKSFDRLHIHMGRDVVTLAAVAIARVIGVAFVIQTHGMVRRDTRVLARVVDFVATRRFLKAASAVLVLTKEEADDIRLMTAGVANLEPVANGVPDVSDSVEVLGSSGDTVDILFCARLHERKRPLTFVDMANELRDRSDLSFSIVGPDDGELDGVTRRIEELGLNDKVRYEGALGYSGVIERLARCSVYVLPSVQEPFPMSLLEAMSLGVPCVCTDSCGPSDELKAAGSAYVTDGSAGQLAEAVRVLVANGGREGSEYGRRAKSHVKRSYSSSSVARTLSEIYLRAG